MKYWITPDGSYYAGEYVAEGSIEVPARPSDYHEWSDGEWVLNVARFKGDRIAAVQAQYNADLYSLKTDWLTAFIANGPAETTRKASIVEQMAALDAQLDADIFEILLGE